MWEPVGLSREQVSVLLWIFKVSVFQSSIRICDLFPNPQLKSAGTSSPFFGLVIRKEASTCKHTLTNQLFKLFKRNICFLTSEFSQVLCGESHERETTSGFFTFVDFQDPSGVFVLKPVRVTVVHRLFLTADL